MADGFLGRWAKRKNDALQGKSLDEPVASAPAALPPSAAAPSSATPEPIAEPPPALTLEDVQGLTKDSDFKPFMNQAVEPGVRNAAMKKLFSDPHFNVMDRMDIYIDDYSQPDPIPVAMLRQMASAKFLKLFDDDEEAEKDALKESPLAAGDTLAPTGVALQEEAEMEPKPVTAVNSSSSHLLQPVSSPAEADPHQDHHAHSPLRLQPDHAAESPGPGRGAA